MKPACDVRCGARGPSRVRSLAKRGAYTPLQLPAAAYLCPAARRFGVAVSAWGDVNVSYMLLRTLRTRDVSLTAVRLRVQPIYTGPRGNTADAFQTAWFRCFRGRQPLFSLQSPSIAYKMTRRRFYPYLRYFIL